MTRAPTTLHEHFRADPRGASSYTQWIEDRIWELLQRPAVWDCVASNGGGVSLSGGNVHEYIARASEYVQTPDGKRFTNTIRLLDGTIIKEWAAGGEAATGHPSKTGVAVEQ